MISVEAENIEPMQPQIESEREGNGERERYW